MLLTSRQIEILFEFYKNEGEIIILNTLAKKFDLSVRTIQNDLAVIRDASQDFGIEIESLPGKGVILNISDTKLASKFIQHAQKHFESTNEFFNQNSRVDFLISYLINQEDYVKSGDLADMLYISQSRISSDLRILRNILKKYNLELISKPSYGIKINGSEINKRFCLIKESIVSRPIVNYIPEVDTNSTNKDLQKIGDILLNVFLKYKYRISEVVLQNLIIHVHVAMERVNKGYPLELESKQELGVQFDQVKVMAEEIIEQCSEYFNLNVYEDEIKYLAINIYGKREIDNEDFITSQTSSMILEALQQIAGQYQIDLTNELELRISLALHLMPLMTRVKNNMQFNNLSMLNLKQTFPLAYNIANDFGLAVFPDNVLLTDDEIGYIAVHFISPVDQKMANLGTNSILIITPYRQSDLFLMKQKILRNTNNIKDIEIINESEIDKTNFKKYSVVLTTEKHIALMHPSIRHINFFLDESDLKKIDFALRGLTTIDYILEKFHEELFYKGKVKTKNEIINLIIQNVHDYFGRNNEFEKSVLAHEKKTPSSYFGNGIAILHPEEPVSETTFISCALLEEPILWDEENYANIVLLVSIEKNNPQAFRLWNIISELISNESFIESYTYVNDFSELYRLITEIYTSLF